MIKMNAQDEKEAAELREFLKKFRESMMSEEEELRKRFEESKNLVIW
jgi:hypothetical protein